MNADRAVMAAALLYAAGGATLFGVRSWRHHRATGRSGYAGFTPGRSASAQLAGGLFAAALAAPVLARTRLLPLLNRPSPAQVAVETAVAAAGLVAAVARTHGRAYTAYAARTGRFLPRSTRETTAEVER